MPAFLIYVIEFIISMIPIIELRGSIPIAKAIAASTGTQLNTVVLLVIAVVGNMLPVPFIYLFARKILLWGKDKRFIGKFFNFCLTKGEKAGKKLEAKAGKGLFVALMLFVGIPLPGTGAWTGTLAASMLDMDFKSTSIAVMCGVLIAGTIIALATFGVFNGIPFLAGLAIK